ncbi:MAG: aminopeptidase P family protein [Peptococcaceae bacterium]|nr:aminopeptidase P family protein [Peptococcaceae bacterium]
MKEGLKGNKEVSKKELEQRLNNFCSIMDKKKPAWDTAIIIGRINQYYFTGTMQDGMLVITKDRKTYFFVRRSVERAKKESPNANIYGMESYRDAAAYLGPYLGNTYLETEIITYDILQRLQKHFKMDQVGSLDSIVLSLRSIKSAYELQLMEEAGKHHNDFLINIVPTLLKEGISEADFSAELYARQVQHGHQGVGRFSMFEIEMGIGQIGFGESSLYPTNFDGPGGAYGMCPAVPFIGSRERKLKKGDLVFVDIAYGINGYHSDKTQVYIFGGKPSSEMLKAHQGCMEIEMRLAEKLKPGAIPEKLYRDIMNSLDEDFKINFMGFGDRRVTFLGHGIGLHINEPPIIANGFKEPLAENMVISLEPKKGIAGKGMVGVENTYIVTSTGGKCITGRPYDIIIV